MFSLCAALSACNSSTTDQSEAVLPQGSATNKISVCAPTIRFGKLARSPYLFVNSKKLGKPSKDKNVIAYASVGDEWELTIEENFWDSSKFGNGLNVIKEQVKSSGDIFIIMTTNNDWGGAISSLAGGTGNIPLAAALGAVEGAVNAKNEYTPFTVSKVTKSEFNKKCP